LELFDVVRARGFAAANTGDRTDPSNPEGRGLALMVSRAQGARPLSDDSAKAEGAHFFTVERMMRAPSEAIFRAWTQEFNTWLATPGSMVMCASVGEPCWFEVIHEGAGHPHYGRYLDLHPGRLIEQTWVTGRNGTDGAETVVRLDLAAEDGGRRRCSWDPGRAKPTEPHVTEPRLPAEGFVGGPGRHRAESEGCVAPRHPSIDARTESASTGP